MKKNKKNNYPAGNVQSQMMQAYKEKKRVDEIKLISADSTVHSPSLNLLSSNTASLFLFFGFFC